MTKHTPGPWEVISWMHQRSGPKIHVQSVDGATGFVRVCTLTALHNGPAIDANARLIAASPALLDVATGLVRYFGDVPPEEFALMVAEDPSSLGMWVEAARKIVAPKAPPGDL